MKVERATFAFSKVADIQQTHEMVDEENWMLCFCYYHPLPFSHTKNILEHRSG